jgi:translation initiation factor 2B subunit (eIF-2B alpha/beta/delta family)
LAETSSQRGPGGLYGVGATEAAEEALRRFAALVAEAEKPSQLLEAVDYLAATVAARPFSAPLANTAREILSRIAEAGYSSIDELKESLTGLVRDVLRRVLEETEEAAEIAARRLEDGDVIVTQSYSRSVVRAFEKAAAMGKKIEVIVAESRPLLDGIETARALARVGIPVTLIVDSATRFVMKDATKVLLGADAVMADGSVIARTGAGIVALAASEARVRVVVVAGTYKLYPETVYGVTIETPALGDEIVPEELREKGVKGYAPLFEHIPPHLIDALATERGVIAPEAVPLLIKEKYGEWPPRVEPLDQLLAKARDALKQLAA